MICPYFFFVLPLKPSTNNIFPPMMSYGIGWMGKKRPNLLNVSQENDWSIFFPSFHSNFLDCVYTHSLLKLIFILMWFSFWWKCWQGSKWKKNPFWDEVRNEFCGLFFCGSVNFSEKFQKKIKVKGLIKIWIHPNSSGWKEVCHTTDWCWRNSL